MIFSTPLTSVRLHIPIDFERGVINAGDMRNSRVNNLKRGDRLCLHTSQGTGRDVENLKQK